MPKHEKGTRLKQVHPLVWEDEGRSLPIEKGQDIMMWLAGKHKSKAEW